MVRGKVFFSPVNIKNKMDINTQPRHTRTHTYKREGNAAEFHVCGKDTGLQNSILKSFLLFQIPSRTTTSTYSIKVLWDRWDWDHIFSEILNCNLVVSPGVDSKFFKKKSAH